MRNREMVKTQDFKKGKIENFRIYNDHLRGQGILSKCKKSHPLTFFRQLILRDTPCLKFRHSVLLRQSEKVKW